LSKLICTKKEEEEEEEEEEIVRFWDAIDNFLTCCSNLFHSVIQQSLRPFFDRSIKHFGAVTFPRKQNSNFHIIGIESRH